MTETKTIYIGDIPIPMREAREGERACTGLTPMPETKWRPLVKTVPVEADLLMADHVQKVLSAYRLEDGELTVSRDEAEEIYRQIINGHPPH